MSKLYDFRDDLKAHIVAAGLGLAASDIIIERQADIIAKVNGTVAKRDSNGVALTIGAAEGNNQNQGSRGLTFETSIELKLWVLPIYNQDALPEEDIAEPLMRLLHLAEIGNGPQHHSQLLKVASFRDVPDPEFLVRQINLKKTISI